MRAYRNIAINATLIFVIAFILQMTLHECGHFAAAISTKLPNVVLYHNYVSANTTSMTVPQGLLFAGSGPLVSLFIGLLFHVICSVRKRKDLLFLFFLYMSLFGYIGFFGYLMIAPFFPYGDTGYIFNALHFPMWLSLTLAILGGLCLYKIIRILTGYFVQMGTPDVISDKKARSSLMSALIKWPLYIGVCVTVLLNLPAPALLSLIYPAFSPFCVMWDYGNAVSKPYPSSKLNTSIPGNGKISSVLVIVFVIIVVINRLLTMGVTVKN